MSPSVVARRSCPIGGEDESAAEFARQERAELARGRGEGGFSLSPQSFLSARDGARIVLPSPNGSALTKACRGPAVFAGCLRNAEAVAREAREVGPKVAVIPAGERWPDGGLRPSLEDLLGSGAILSHLAGRRSPEAEAAIGAFLRLRTELRAALGATWSGRELIGWGYEGDLDLAAKLDVSRRAPRLRNGAYAGISERR